ncbi:deoxyribonuclease-1-like [Pagrus major]|uniref:deoxyribonuclease-1-like n=1 Tax=Pagrus major TaxID=143350 RepID=UPI003CC883BF
MKIAAFNVKNFGWKKVNNNFVRTQLIKIVSRYSLVVVLEVVDKSGKAMDKFLTELNDFGSNKRHPYAMKCSEPLGRSSHKEKFVFFYRVDEVKVIKSYQWDEGYADHLAREPFLVHFSFPNTVVKKLVLIPVHTKPDSAETELSALDDVVKAVRSNLRTDNIMILGDFNADGRYLSKKKKEKVSIFSPPYCWLIDDDADTTSSNNNDHTYDRIVVYGEDMYDAVVPDSAQPFNFQREYSLSDEETQQISDHYPVEVELNER